MGQLISLVDYYITYTQINNFPDFYQFGILLELISNLCLIESK